MNVIKLYLAFDYRMSIGYNTPQLINNIKGNNNKLLNSQKYVIIRSYFI